MTRQLEIPVAPGELLDKLSILEIKLDRMTGPGKLANVRREYELLDGIWQDAGLETDDIGVLRSELLAVNRRLWEIEDAVRECEREKDFGNRFIALARSVYMENDERAAIKKKINLTLGSDIIEEKSYKNYR